MYAFLLERRGVGDNTRLLGENGDASSRGTDIIAKSLAAERTLAGMRKRVSLADIGEI